MNDALFFLDTQIFEYVGSLHIGGLMRFSNSLISDWINNPKFSWTPSIRIVAHKGPREPDRVPDDTKSGQKNTPYRTPLKGKHNAPQFDRFWIFATNCGDNFRGGQIGSIFVFTTRSWRENKPVSAPDFEAKPYVW